MPQLKRSQSAKLPLFGLASGVALTLVLLGVVAYRQGMAHIGSEPYEALYGFDVNDKSQLVTYTSDIFTGRVRGVQATIQLPTSDPESTIPITLYDVQVQEVIKGDADGVVTVRQDGGFEPVEQVNRFEENDVPLVADRDYLFVTVKTPNEGWYSIYVPGLANIPIDNKLERAALIAEYSALVGIDLVTATHMPTPANGSPAAENNATETVETPVPSETPTTQSTSLPTESPTTEPSDTPTATPGTPTA